MATNNYPFIECEEHEGLQRSYIVCRHVSEENTPVYHFVKCSDSDMGEILCHRCSSQTGPKKLGEYTVCCESGANEHGWTKIAVQ